MADYRFPSGFLWGTATASYQVEGAVREDDRGESIWDRFAHTPGKTFNGDTGDVACDHYHRYAEDIQIMQSLGVQAYRFSIAWPRILPQGDGPVNPAGLDFYDRLIDGLLAANITPLVTLYHWDQPQTLQDRYGGWVSRDMVDQFVHYAGVVSQHFGDRVKHWATFNEPRMVSLLGYEIGHHAPGLRDRAAAARVVHHLLLAHGATVPVLRANAGPDSQIGIVLALSALEALPEATPEARAAMPFMNALFNHLFADPIFLGAYPAQVIDAPDFPGLPVEPGDMAIIHTPIDFLGVNYYSRIVVGSQPPRPGERVRVPGAEYTEMGWEVYPPGLYNMLKHMHERYAPPALYITENGAAFVDTLAADGGVHDERRVAYLREHFRMAAKAIQDGVPLRGYFVWSLMDNFEWAHGYSKRFGLVYVDFQDGQRRILKDSAHFYRAVIAANGVPENE